MSIYALIPVAVNGTLTPSHVQQWDTTDPVPLRLQLTPPSGLELLSLQLWPLSA